MNEIKAAIKDAIFESVMMGEDIRMTLGRLHFVDGFERQDIMDAFDEMRTEAAADYVPHGAELLPDNVVLAVPDAQVKMYAAMAAFARGGAA
ncbi:hypothetical protein [Paenibacillus sp. FSL L8-0708]|uniref:hypothetical protein n=1 Tax=Paenibacillus sp. FSL L8-0708 TaxID=2975311 RepID=UPI0030FC56ED